MNLSDKLNLRDGLLGTRLFSIGDTPINLERIIVFLVVLAITYFVSRLLRRALEHGFRMRGVKDIGQISVAKRLLHYLVLVVGIGIAVESIGISLGALFAAGAIFAIGIGFAMQNIVQNFVSGIILLVERSIKPGDILQVDGRFVKVRHMGIRSTIARTLDEEEIIVPNSSIVQATVTNYTLQDSLYRLRCTVGVIYGSDMALVKETLEGVASKMGWRDAGKKPVIFLIDFGDSAVVWEVSIWINDPWLMGQARSDLNEAIWWALKEAGIVIAFPQLDVHFDQEVSTSLRDMAKVS